MNAPVHPNSIKARFRGILAGLQFKFLTEALLNTYVVHDFGVVRVQNRSLPMRSRTRMSLPDNGGLAFSERATFFPADTGIAVLSTQATAVRRRAALSQFSSFCDSLRANLNVCSFS